MKTHQVIFALLFLVGSIICGYYNMEIQSISFQSFAFGYLVGVLT